MGADPEGSVRLSGGRGRLPGEGSARLLMWHERSSPSHARLQKKKDGKMTVVWQVRHARPGEPKWGLLLK